MWRDSSGTLATCLEREVLSAGCWVLSAEWIQREQLSTQHSELSTATMPRMPRILLTNDDGIYSEGLRKLAAALKPAGDVIIVAPDREQSAASHALTLNRPLRLLQLEENEG